ncbi:extracellular solute-binding protein [Tautonia sociabilis]|uniref:Extracellular solute-binding protein n=2 Tax=Tautonia sociabilis TaxID=2080755 RepID=A0A432MNF1_9BACT|nr:extracellular solute-binding protein [Tautonia sociabilis]
MLFVRLGPDRVREIGHRVGDVLWPALAGLLFLVCLQLLLDRRGPSDRVVLAVDLADDELIAFNDLIRSLEPRLGARIVLRPIDSGQQFERLSRMVGRGRVQWDLIACDNDLVGAMDAAGLVQDLGPEWAPPPTLLPPLHRLTAPGGGPARFAPLRVGVRLGYFDDRPFRGALRRSPPADLEELVEVARRLRLEYRAPRVVLQAGAGKPAATTLCEVIGTDPRAWNRAALAGPFHALRSLKPLLHPESIDAGFDRVRDLLDCEEVDLACNWTSGDRPWAREPGDRRRLPAVYPGWQRFHVLGGDVLAIPVEAPNPELARRLASLLVEARTQRELAGWLHWIPVRQDAFDGLPDGLRRASSIALASAVLRPADPLWPDRERALSQALRSLIAGDEEVDAILDAFLGRIHPGRPALSPSEASVRPPAPDPISPPDRSSRTSGAPPS